MGGLVNVMLRTFSEIKLDCDVRHHTFDMYLMRGAPPAGYLSIQGPRRKGPRGPTEVVSRGDARRDLRKPCRAWLRAAQAREEAAQEGRALGGQQARNDLDAMVEAFVVEQGVECADGAGLRIVAAEVEPADARVDERARAHGTRLHRDVEVGVGEAPAAER